MLARVVGVRTPVLEATIERRLLIAYRLDPDAVVHLVPGPFSLQLVNGYAVGVISLDRVTALRPRGFPAVMGYTCENAAHRIAVEWDQDGRTATGAFVLARHTDSQLGAAFGDRFFPGARERAEFEVVDAPSALSVAFTSRDDRTTVEAAVVVTKDDEGGELFGSKEDAWRFFRRGGVSYSLRRRGGVLDGIDMRAQAATATAASIAHVSSSRFPAALGVPDSALIMRDLQAEWRAAFPPGMARSGV